MAHCPPNHHQRPSFRFLAGLIGLALAAAVGSGAG